MKKQKKAQVQQVFVYIMAIVIIGAILILGLRSILNIMDKACDVDELSFKQDIDNIINKYSRSGNRGFETLNVPCDYEKLCFINTTTNCENIDNEIIKAECIAGTGNNVFITKGQYTEPLFSIPNLVTNENLLCIEPRSNNYYLKLEGIGQGKVLVSNDDLN